MTRSVVRDRAYACETSMNARSRSGGLGGLWRSLSAKTSWSRLHASGMKLVSVSCVSFDADASVDNVCSLMITSL